MSPADAISVVTGAGGFIGGHLVRALLDEGRAVRAVDIKPADRWHQRFEGADNRRLDLRERAACEEAVDGAHTVFNLASDMGGMGFIARHKARCMLSVIINTHLLEASVDHGVDRFFFSSSACVYPLARQASASLAPLREEDAYPADPEDGYGWEKLFSERMCRHFTEDFGLATRVARFHNVYGPFGEWTGGREKAPAAICRKVAEADLSGFDTIEVWGDGEQTRSFTWIDDCIHGTRLITDSDVSEPLNVGSAELITINQLVDLVCEIAGVELKRRHVVDEPQGVRGRNSDNERIRRVLGWEPATPLATGLEATYRWIRDQVAAQRG